MECFSWCYCMGNETAYIGTHTIATRGGFNESKPKIVSKRNLCGWWNGDLCILNVQRMKGMERYLAIF